GRSPMKKPHRPKRPRPKRRNPKNHASRRTARKQRGGTPGRREAPRAAASSSTNALRLDLVGAPKTRTAARPAQPQERAERPPPRHPAPPTPWTFSALRAVSALLCVWMIVSLAIGPSLATVGCSEPPKQGPPPIEE